MFFTPSGLIIAYQIVEFESVSMQFVSIPIRVEALSLERDSYVCSPLADFQKLPWNDGSQDHNFSNPFY